MFKKSVANLSKERLEKVLIADKHFNPSKISKVMKSDLFFLLKNYSDVTEDNLKLEINVDEMGSYNIVINATCNRLKKLGSI
jgi:septum formation topological specificity factor MinE